MPTPSRACFQALNMPAEAIPESMAAFELYAPSRSDLWRRPNSSQDTSTAPILYTALRHPFVCAEVTVSANWQLEWDQAGLVIFAGVPPGLPTTIASSPDQSVVVEIRPDDPPGLATAENPTTTTTTIAQARPASLPDATANTSSGLSLLQQQQQTLSELPPYALPRATKWTKVGLEYNHNICAASTVCANQDGADWCLNSLPTPQAQRGELRVKLERIGYALYIYYEDTSYLDQPSPPPAQSSHSEDRAEPDPCRFRDARFGISRWRKLREVTGFFFGVEDKSVRVGVYASRPANWPLDEGGRRGESDLRVEFDGLQIF